MHRIFRFAFRALPVAAVCTVSFIGSARAQVPLLSNFDTPSDTSAGSNIGPADRKSVAFTVGSTALSITSVNASLALYLVNSGSSVASAAIYSTNGTDAPVTFVGSLGTQTVTAAQGVVTTYTFSSAAPITLAANTRYSLLLDYVSGNQYFWYRTNTNVLPTARNGSGITNPVYTFNNANGGYDLSGTYNRFQLNGALVAAAPEPTSIALAAFALPACIGMSRRRRTATR